MRLLFSYYNFKIFLFPALAANVETREYFFMGFIYNSDKIKTFGVLIRCCLSDKLVTHVRQGYT